MSDTIVKVLVITGIAVGAWILLGSPTNIQDLRTDIENLKNQFAPQKADAQGQQDQDAGTQQQDQSQQGAAGAAPDVGGNAPTAGGGGDADAGTGGGGGGAPSAPPSAPDSDVGQQPDLTKDVADSIASKQNDIGATQGTAPPEQANLPPVVIPKKPPHKHDLPPGHPLAPPVATTDPHAKIAKHQLALKRHAAFIKHHPPHAVAKTHPVIIPPHHHFHREHYRGTPGWYTAIGHHHCFQGQPGCICTDCSKCNCHGPGSFRGHHHPHHRAHLAYSYNTTMNQPGDLFSYY